MGIRLKFILLLIACLTIPIIAIITNIDDWLNNNQNLELFKERQKYHDLGKSFENLFQSYLTSIHLLSEDYAKDLDKYNRRKKLKGLSFSRVNSDPSYWTNGFSFKGRFFEREFKTWSPARRANFLGKNIRLKSLLNKSVIKKLLSPSDEFEWETYSPSLIQVFALEKNLLDGKAHTAQNLQLADQKKLSRKFQDLRIQPLIYYGSESNQWIWDQLIMGIVQDLYEYIAQPNNVSTARMNKLVKYLGNSLPNSRGNRFPIEIEGGEVEIAWNTVPSNFNLNDFINGDSSEEIPDCISVSIILMEKARNRFLKAWLNSDLEKLFTRIDESNRSNWKKYFHKFSSLLKTIEESCEIMFFDSLGVQTLDNIEPLTTDGKKFDLKNLKPQHLDYIYNQNGRFGMDINENSNPNFSKNIVSNLYDLAHNSGRSIDFTGTKRNKSIIGSMISIQSLPSSAFLVVKNDQFLIAHRKKNIRDFTLLIFFLTVVSWYFYTLLHKKLVLPVTKLSNAVLKIIPGVTISLRDDSKALNQELESLHYEFDDLQNRMNLDYKAMQLSRKLLSTCTASKVKTINLALATEISIFLNAKAVCLGLYQNGISRRGSDYSIYTNNDENLSNVLKRQMLHEIQMNTSIPVGVSLLDTSDSYVNAYQIHVKLESASDIGALIRVFEPEDDQLIQTGKFEEVMVQIVPSLLKKEIDELQAEQKVGSELQKRFQTTNLDVKSFDYAQVYMPARGLAGDTILAWKDSTESNLYVSIGDTAGKGVGPSLYGATCVSLLRPITEDQKHPNLILESLNRTLCEYQSTHMFLTFFLARINLRTFRVDFASAGHNQMLLCRNNGTFEELSAKGIPLGIMPDVNFQSCETHIEVGDRLFLYTDGVTEAEDLYMELYGKERLLTILSKYNDKSSIDTLNAIKSSLGKYTRGLESSDDITMISLRRES